MMRTTLLLAALLLAFSTAVCGAGAPLQADVSCKDGVCVITPSGDAGAAKAACANPNNNAVPDLEANWARDAETGPHDEFAASSSEPVTGVVFTCSNPVKDFKFLSLPFKDFQNGKPVFLVKELYTKPVLKPERPLLVKMTFIGSYLP